MAGTWEWYNSVYSTRRLSGGKELLISTIWSARDLPSRILESELADAWTVVRLPAFAEDDDPLGRPLGEPLWPEKYDRQFLNEQQIKLGTKAFSALYQSLPLGGEGSRFKDEWFGRHTSVPENLGKAIFVDSSFGKTQTSDWTVILTAGIDAAGKVYILDVIRLRLQYTELLSTMLNVVAKNRGIPLFVEDAASGQSLIQSLRAAGVPARPLKPVGTKEYRFSAIVPYIENGFVALPQAAPWLNVFLREILANGPLYDDQTDALAYCCLVMAQYVRSTQGAPVQYGPLNP